MSTFLESTKNLTHEDTRKMRSLGRNYVVTQMDRLVDEAVELLLIATNAEASYLMSEFEEGVRNYASYPMEAHDAMWVIKDRLQFARIQESLRK